MFDHGGDSVANARDTRGIVAIILALTIGIGILAIGATLIISEWDNRPISQDSAVLVATVFGTVTGVIATYMGRSVNQGATFDEVSAAFHGGAAAATPGESCPICDAAEYGGTLTDPATIDDWPDVPADYVPPTIEGEEPR